MAAYIGTSGWAYKAWQPDFYPPKLPQTKYLEHYASQLAAVEVNYSFRRLIPEKTQQTWIAATPRGFRFCVKAHQRITHWMRLKGAGAALQDFLGSLNPLARAGRLGAVLFQLPPNLKADERLLSDFLKHLPRSVRAAMEFRHESWFDGKIFDLLAARGVALCVAGSEDLVTPDVRTASFAYYRLRKPEYSARELGKIARRLRERATGRGDVYAFFKHEENPDSPLNALAVQRRLRAKAA